MTSQGAGWRSCPTAIRCTRRCRASAPGWRARTCTRISHHTRLLLRAGGRADRAAGRARTSRCGWRRPPRLGAAARRPRLPQRRRRRTCAISTSTRPGAGSRLHALDPRRRSARLRPARPAPRRRPPDRRGRTSPAGEEIADGVTLLADLAVLRVTRERGATEPRRLHDLASYFALEGDLVLTHGAEEVYAPTGRVRAGAARPRARGRRAVPVRHGAVVDSVKVSVLA